MGSNVSRSMFHAPSMGGRLVSMVGMLDASIDLPHIEPQRAICEFYDAIQLISPNACQWSNMKASINPSIFGRGWVSIQPDDAMFYLLASDQVRASIVKALDRLTCSIVADVAYCP